MEENAITEDEKKKISDNVLNLILNEKTNISGADIKNIQVGEDNTILLKLKLYIDSKVADDSEYTRNDINQIINGPGPPPIMEGGGFWDWMASDDWKAYKEYQKKRKSNGGKRYKKSHKKSNKKRRSRKTRNKRK